MNTPAQVMARLDAIDTDLAIRQNTYEAAALAWFRAKRDQEHAAARVFLSQTGTVAERRAHADLETALIGKEDEALYESLRAVMRTLETRATIGMAILKSQGRS